MRVQDSKVAPVAPKKSNIEDILCPKNSFPRQAAKQMFTEKAVSNRCPKIQTIVLGAFMILCLSIDFSLCLKAPNAVSRTIKNAILPQIFQK